MSTDAPALTENIIDLPVDDVRLVMELYPRTETKMIDSVVDQYRDALDELPPIIIARGGILVDGMHRWQAHRREGRTTIKAVDMGNLSDVEIYDLALELNAKHGRQLSAKEKRNNAARLWTQKVHLDSAGRAKDISSRLSMSVDAVYAATKDQRKAEKQAQQDKAWDMWLDCHIQTEVAEALGVDQKTISNWLGNSGSSQNFLEPPESRQHFDVWQFPTTDRAGGGQQSYFGAVPPQVVENLLWFFTEPGQVVVDPFAGSGTTVEVAKRMGRRVWAADIRGNHYSPHLPIHRHDATQGWPDAAPRKADLVFLDPPYWRQATGQYSSEPNELAEMDLDAFHTAWVKVAQAAMEHANRIAYIISPTEDKDEDVVIDHATELLHPFTYNGWRVQRRIIVPYSTQQATGQQVTWAREKRRMLKLYRDLVVLAK